MHHAGGVAAVAFAIHLSRGGNPHGAIAEEASIAFWRGKDSPWNGNDASSYVHNVNYKTTFAHSPEMRSGIEGAFLRYLDPVRSKISSMSEFYGAFDAWMRELREVSWIEETKSVDREKLGA